jgi:hypothetical protein
MDKRARSRMIKRLVSEKITLTSLADEEDESVAFWVKVKKYSIIGAEQVANETVSMQDSLPPEIVEKMALKSAELAEAQGDEDIAWADVFTSLDFAERREVLKLLQDGKSHLYYKAVLINGVDSHNLEDKDGETQGMSEKLADELMEYPELAQEIVKKVEQFNKNLSGKN